MYCKAKPFVDVVYDKEDIFSLKFQYTSNQSMDRNNEIVLIICTTCITHLKMVHIHHELIHHLVFLKVTLNCNKKPFIPRAQHEKKLYF